MPFMALDLLTKEAWEGKIARLYRHDCESFAWVLLWICCRYDDGEEIRNAPLGELKTHDYWDCFVKKFSIFRTIVEITPTASYERFWPAARSLLIWPQLHRFDRDLRRAMERDATSEPEIDEVVNTCRKVLETEGFDVML
jgi:hypothetical protein